MSSRNRRRVNGATALGDLLETIGCDVRTVHSGQSALAVAPAFRPQLVIVDLNMPGMDGFETARRLRAQPWARSAVFASYSGADEPTATRLSKAAGFHHHVAKPAAIDAFEALVRMVRNNPGAVPSE